MPKRKTKSKAWTFESAGGKDGKTDTFVRLYSSMIHSDAFVKLTPRQKSLYTFCKEKFYGFRKPKADFPDISSLQGDDLFYMTFSDVKGTGLYTATMEKNYRADMKALEQHGFIEVAAMGKGGRKNIYKFSSKWQNSASEK